MTMQRHDTIVYQSEEQVIFSQPLEKYFEYINRRPSFVSLNTSLTIRGYYADWAILENKLFLIDFKGYQLQSNWTETEYDLTDLFPKAEKPIFANWFTGEILLPNGGNISHSIYRIYENLIKLTFVNGILINEKIEVNDPTEKTATNRCIGTIGAGS